jgi:NNP family nitrate/nitrite transporter-like MFS transporter
VSVTGIRAVSTLRAVSATVARWSPGPAVTVAVATVGLGLNLRAWIMLSPVLAGRPDVRLEQYVVLMGLPLLVAALVRLPVGVLTDRYGARVMFPVVSLASAGSVVGLGLSGSLPEVVVAGTAAGTAGTAFVVGAALVSRTIGYGRRGLALGVLSLGPVVAVAVSVVSRLADPGGRRAALGLGAALVGFAVLAGVVLRDRAGWYRGSLLRRGLAMVRVAAGTSLSLLYALALGGVVAVAVYLPAYLTAVFDLPWYRALVLTTPVVVLATVTRLVGGWWTDRRPTAGLLPVCYATAAGMCLLLALAPRLWWSTVPLIAAVAACDGLASGALLALIGKAASADGVGAVMGMTGAAAAFGAVGLSMLLAGVDRLSGSGAAAWLLLAGILLAVAVYVRAYGLRVGMGLAVRDDTGHSPTAMTVAVLGESDTQWGAAAVVARLADLATRDELVVVYGSDTPARPHREGNVVVAGLRDRLPRHKVVAVQVEPAGDVSGRDATLVSDFVDAGAIAVAVTPTRAVGTVAAQLSTYLRADRVLKVSYTRTAGADLHQVWNRDRTGTA